MKKKSTVRVRFAPTPTGPLHLGGLRIALANYDFAERSQGKMILRIEDTDPKSAVPEFESPLLDSLKTFGIEWNEGPDIGGEFGPYRQSERFAIYEKKARDLVAEGKAYFCFCSREDIRNRSGKRWGYDGHCRKLASASVRRKPDQGKMPCLRLKAQEHEIAFEDLLCGKIRWRKPPLDDFAILRADGTALYNFAVVVDDILMGISHVIRGQDHLSNVPAQLLLYEALGAPAPLFSHLPLILSSDGRKLSKSTGAPPVESYLHKGILPKAIIAYLRGLPGHGTRRLDARSIHPVRFDWDRIEKANAVCLKSEPPEVVGKHGAEWLAKQGYIPEEETRTVASKSCGYAEALKGRVRSFQDLVPFCAKGDPSMLPATFRARILRNFKRLREWQAGLLEDLLERYTEEQIRDLREALTGASSGPPLSLVLMVVGREEVLNRLRHPPAVRSRSLQRIENYGARSLGFNKISNVRSIEGGYENELFRVRTASGSFIIKINVNLQWAPLLTEYRAMRLLQGQDLAPIPERLDLSYSYVPCPALVYHMLPGRAASARSHLLSSMAKAISKIHEITEEEICGQFPGFPEIESSLMGAYLETLRYWREYLLCRAKEGMVDDELVRRIAEILEGLRPWVKKTMIHWRTPFVKTLCHGDLRIHNFLYYSRKMKILDWERAGIGDPALDFAWFLAFTAPLDRRRLFASYDDQSQRARLPAKPSPFVQRAEAYRTMQLIAWPIHLLYLLYDHRYGTARVTVSDADFARNYEADILKKLAYGFTELAGIHGRDEVFTPGRVALMGSLALPPIRMDLEHVPKNLRISLDGASATLKSLIGPALADKLGYRYINSGALYRAVTAAALRLGVPIQDKRSLVKLAQGASFEMIFKSRYPYFRLRMKGKDVTDLLYTTPVEERVAAIAQIPEVRRIINGILKKWGDEGGVVMEGRDIGTSVLPSAELKVFATASNEEKKRRKFEQLREMGKADPETIAKAVEERDALDLSRTTDPLTIPEGALILDTTNMSVEGAVHRILLALEENLRK